MSKVQIKFSINCNYFSNGSTRVYFETVFSLDESSKFASPQVLAEKEWTLGTQVAKIINDEIEKGNQVIVYWSEEKLLCACICFQRETDTCFP